MQQKYLKYKNKNLIGGMFSCQGAINESNLAYLQENFEYSGNLQLGFTKNDDLSTINLTNPVRKIGEGSFGVIYIGNMRIKMPGEIIHNEEIAIKEIKKGRLKPHDIYFLCRELSTLCNYHDKYSMKYYGYSFTDKDEAYIFTEYINGYTLNEIKTTLHPYMKLLLSIQCVLGLYSLHYNNIVHRDIKNDNIMTTRDFTIKYVDFGFSCNIITSCKDGEYVGTPYFNSPELIDNYVKVNNYMASDLWALGCTIFEFFSGEYFVLHPSIRGTNRIKKIEDLRNLLHFLSENTIYESVEHLFTQFSHQLSAEQIIYIKNIIINLLKKNPDERRLILPQLSDIETILQPSETLGQPLLRPVLNNMSRYIENIMSAMSAQSPVQPTVQPELNSTLSVEENA
jgi:serine/threonine protein kinase